MTMDVIKSARLFICLEIIRFRTKNPLYSFICLWGTLFKRIKEVLEGRIFTASKIFISEQVYYCYSDKFWLKLQIFLEPHSL
ncbi:hypothetical protein BGP_5678 [Beggiatoa sp. PS]|nr:hypothetical protein BGP_5678 [Beggiatoa sp. PS]